MTMNIIQSILNLMSAQIEKYGLELMQHYPNDLLVHDKAILERIAVPGAHFAWMVGNSHTHLVPLGLHAEETKMVEYLTNMASDDRFYECKISHGGDFSMKEIDRNAFAALSTTRIQYQSVGSKNGFWVMQGKQKVGYIDLKMVVESQHRHVKAVITPVAGISPLSKAALETWCSYGVIHLAGTFFIQSSLDWAEPYVDFQKAA